MTKRTLNGHDLLNMGYESGPAIGMAVKTANQLLTDGAEVAVVKATLANLLVGPNGYVEDPNWADTAAAILHEQEQAVIPALREEPAPLNVWGRKLIDSKSFDQINNAARLPVTLRVALMPDAHVGYGLPIGGVAALDGAIAPYMVGVDIGCRMHATIFDRKPAHLKQKPKIYEELIMNHTFFGRSGPRKGQYNEHEILDDSRWRELPPFLRDVKTKAEQQLGTSGGGNHFVEWTKLTVLPHNPLGIDAGEYIALVTHSGSRGVGYKIANHYSQLAEKICSFLPKQMRKLGYLNWKMGDAQEYEMAMNLAGDFARANHEVIHERITNALGGHVLGTIQNHHNFAWRVDRANADPVFIHRKGATPAADGVLGIIPGSMATPGFFVEGRCDSAENVLDHPSLNSAAHGSGRKMGRKQAIKNLDMRNVRQFLAQRGVTLLGGGLDEAPNAYKNSRDVIKAQSDLVKVWAEFDPVIVRMASDGGRSLGANMRDKGQSRDRKRYKKNHRRR